MLDPKNLKSSDSLFTSALLMMFMIMIIYSQVVLIMFMVYDHDSLFTSVVLRTESVLHNPVQSCSHSKSHNLHQNLLLILAI